MAKNETPTCAGTSLTKACDLPGIAYRDSKGYAYCEEHGTFLKANGRKGMVRLKKSSVKASVKDEEG